MNNYSNFSMDDIMKQAIFMAHVLNKNKESREDVDECGSNPARDIKDSIDCEYAEKDCDTEDKNKIATKI